MCCGGSLDGDGGVSDMLPAAGRLCRLEQCGDGGRCSGQCGVGGLDPASCRVPLGCQLGAPAAGPLNQSCPGASQVISVSGRGSKPCDSVPGSVVVAPSPVQE